VLVGPLDQVRKMFDLADDSVRTPEHNGVKLVDPAGIVSPVAYPLQRAPLVLLYQPADTLTATMVLPWLLAQAPAALLAAGIYGVLEGHTAAMQNRRVVRGPLARPCPTARF
jgi:hypothetical protein